MIDLLQCLFWGLSGECGEHILPISNNQYDVCVLFCDHQAVDHLESFISDCDRRTELAKKRLVETQEEISAEVAEKVS